MDIENEIIIMEKFKFSPNLWFLIRTLLLAIEEEKPDPFFSYIKADNFAKNNLRHDLLVLQTCDVLTNSYKIPDKGASFNYKSLEFNKLFLKEFYKNSGELGQALFELYPPFLETNTTLYPLRNIAKKYNSLEEFFYAYGKTIKFNPKKHMEILEILNWGKENNLVTWTLIEFVISNKWLELEILRKTDYGEFKTIENI